MFLGRLRLINLGAREVGQAQRAGLEAAGAMAVSRQDAHQVDSNRT